MTPKQYQKSVFLFYKCNSARGRWDLNFQKQKGIVNFELYFSSFNYTLHLNCCNYNFVFFMVLFKSVIKQNCISCIIIIEMQDGILI